MNARTIAMPIALAAAVIGSSILTAQTAEAQYRQRTIARTTVQVVPPGTRIISSGPVYSQGRVYYNRGYNQPYRSYRPAYPNTYYNGQGTYYRSGTYYSTPRYGYSPYNSYYGGYGYSPYYGSPGANVGGAIGQAIGGNQGGAVGAAIGAAVGR